MAKFRGGINNGVNLNKIGYKKFFEAQISEGGVNSSNAIFLKWSNFEGELKRYFYFKKY